MTQEETELVYKWIVATFGDPSEWTAASVLPKAVMASKTTKMPAATARSTKRRRTPKCTPGISLTRRSCHDAGNGRHLWETPTCQPAKSCSPLELRLAWL